MGFLRKIKKAVKGVAKIAIKTAPLWSSFVPGGGFAMTVLRSALKTPLPSPAAKNRFPLPNPLYQGGATVQAAVRIHRMQPRLGNRGGPFAARAGMMWRQRVKAGKRVRYRALRQQSVRRARMVRVA